jgi:uncharacterized protein YecE (DUF72 family)
LTTAPGHTPEELVPCKICIGVQGFSPPDWVGTFYPPGLAQRAWLSFYARVFNTVEMNTTFYAIPSASTVKGWAMRVPEHFVFSAKMPRGITHDKQLQGVEAELAIFVQRVRMLGDKLGAVLIQFPPSFTRRLEPQLRAFLRLLPDDLRFAAEFRHPSWHDDAVFQLLREHDVAWCINHWQDLPIVAETTAGFAYFRLVGDHQQFTDLGRVQRDRSQELDSLAKTIVGLASRLETMFVYVNNHYAGHAPATVNQLKGLLGLPVINPRSLWPEQPQLLPGMEM